MLVIKSMYTLENARSRKTKRSMVGSWLGMRNLVSIFVCVVDFANMADKVVPPHVPSRFQRASIAPALEVVGSLSLLNVRR